MSGPVQDDVLAEETHSGRSWSLIILLALIGPMIGVALLPSTVGRWAVALVGVIAIGTFAMSWSGFQYRFLRQGVEIRMLGFRLRSIPRQSIVSYSTEPWAFIRGYGIRGIGSPRAYGWCNQALHIKTSDGAIFSEPHRPERIVCHLDLV